MTPTILTAILLCALAGVPQTAGASTPEFTADLPNDGGRVDRPPGLTDIDAWLLNAQGRPSVRLRQRLPRRCFTRTRGRRCLVRYSARSFATGYDTTRYGARVYGWVR